MLKELTLDTLKDTASGTVAVAFDHHLRRAVADCIDRPGAKTAREVSLLVKITPIIDEDGLCEETNVEMEITSKMPKHVSRPVNCTVRKGGRLVFNDMSEDNAQQMTIDEV